MISDIQSFLSDHKQKKFGIKWLPRLHDYLMEEYGWIPLEEFKKIPLPTLWNLLEQIDERKQAEKKHNEKMNAKIRSKRK